MKGIGGSIHSRTIDGSTNFERRGQTSDTREAIASGNVHFGTRGIKRVNPHVSGMKVILCGAQAKSVNCR